MRGCGGVGGSPKARRGPVSSQGRGHRHGAWVLAVRCAHAQAARAHTPWGGVCAARVCARARAEDERRQGACALGRCAHLLQVPATDILRAGGRSGQAALDPPSPPAALSDRAGTPARGRRPGLWSSLRAADKLNRPPFTHVACSGSPGLWVSGRSRGCARSGELASLASAPRHCPTARNSTLSKRLQNYPPAS